MADVKFYLENRTDKSTGKPNTKNVPIILYYSFGNRQRFQYYTGLRIDAKLWNEETMKARGNSDMAVTINEELARLGSILLKTHKQALANDQTVNVEYFKRALAGEEPAKPKSLKSFQEAMHLYVEECKLTRKPNTIKAIRSSLKQFADFSKETKTPLSFEGITIEFYNKFLRWCFEKKGFRNNHTGKLIKDLKAFMGWATDNGYNTNMDFRKKGFKRLGEDTEIIFLKYEELMHFYNVYLPSESLQNVRDVFCFGCFTGLRFSDIKNLRRENVHGDMLIFRVIKTNERNTVPLNKYSKEILERHAGEGDFCLPVISEQKTNDYLKEALRFAEIDRKVQINHFQGAKRITESFPLHEIVTFHISKKTFMTNFLAKGGSLHTAMAITGNKSFKTAKRYFTVVDTLKQEEMKKVFG